MKTPQKQSRAAIYAASEKSLYGYVVELCKAHLATYPDEVEVWEQYAKALGNLSRYQEAESAFDQAIERTPEEFHSFIYSLRGHMNKRRGDYLEAEKYYSKAIAVNPQNPLQSCYLIYLGVVAFRRGDLQFAEQKLREAIECGGEIEEAYFNMGGVMMAQEKYKEAAENYQRAIELDPQYKYAKFRLKEVKEILRQKT